MGRSKKGRCVKKNKQLDIEVKEDLVKAPRSYVIHRGLPGDHIVELTRDFRKVMEPFTAGKLKERKRNTIKDFVSVAGFFHVTHMCIFTRTELGMYLKLCRIPRGPTLSFKIVNFALAREVVSQTTKQFVFKEAFEHSPLIVLNKFSGEGMHLKLMTSMFQNMFPTINLTTVKLTNLRRCVLLNYDPETKLIEFRHYAIKVIPIGLSKNVKKLVQARIPNLAKCEDFSDFLTRPTMSESEGEDDPASHVILPQTLSSRGNHEKGESKIKLYELGPRLTLQLIKVEDGLMDGEVLYHELVSKTEEEKLLIQKRREKKRKLKENRKKVQEENKNKKEQKKQELKEKSLKGIRKKSETDVLMQKLAKESYEATKSDDDDDAQYYRDEVGEEPDKELFQQATVRNKRPSGSYLPRYKVKKPRLSTEEAKKKASLPVRKGHRDQRNFTQKDQRTFKQKDKRTFKQKDKRTFKHKK